jgi:hypothetical protein
MTTKLNVTYRIEVEQDDTQVRGNAMASGDDAADKAVEDEILDRLDRGDVWAWAMVKVVAECEGFEGFDTLCGCCYKDEADFKTGGYFEQMKDQAFEDLLNNMGEVEEQGKRAARLLFEHYEGG